MSFLGSTIAYSYRYPTVDDIYAGIKRDILAGDGAEGHISDGSFNHAIDISSNSIVITNSFNFTYNHGHAFNGYFFEDILDNIPEIVEVVLSTNIIGLDGGKLTYTGNSIAMNMAGMNLKSGDFINLTVSFYTPPPPNYAPSFAGPSTLFLYENSKDAGLLQATDPEGDTLTYSIAGGRDSDLFEIDAATGALKFKQPVTYDDAADSTDDNSYFVSVGVNDGVNSVTRLLTVTVKPNETPVTIDGGDGGNSFDAPARNSVILGGDGYDTIKFHGARSDFTIQKNDDGKLEITSPLGFVTSIDDIEKLIFTDSAYNLEIASQVNTLPASQVGAIIDLYIAYFNRAPEADGLGYWINQARSGMTFEQMGSEFYKAAITLGDITGYSADMPLRDFIVQTYNNVLNRSGSLVSDEDVDWWVREITEGRQTVENLPARFINDSRLFADDPQWSWMVDLLNDKVKLGWYHTYIQGIDYSSQGEAVDRTSEIMRILTEEGIDAASRHIGLGTIPDWLDVLV